MLLRHAIGHVLRSARLRTGLTLREVSERSRVSLPYLSELERGRKEASSEILAAVCVVLDLSLAALLVDVTGELAMEDAALAPVLDLRSSVVGADRASAVAPGDAVLLAA